MGFSEIIWNVHLQIHPEKILSILQKISPWERGLFDVAVELEPQ